MGQYYLIKSIKRGTITENNLNWSQFRIKITMQTPGRMLISQVSSAMAHLCLPHEGFPSAIATILFDILITLSQSVSENHHHQQQQQQ